MLLVFPLFVHFFCLLQLNLCHSFFSGTMQARILKYGIPMKNECMYCGIETQVHGSYFSIFHLFFFRSPNYKSALNFFVGVFSGTVRCRILKRGKHMDNELLYCGIENLTPCSYSSLYLSIFLSFNAKFVSQFSPELCKQIFKCGTYLCRMSVCIVGLRFRVMALIFLFLSIFLSFPICLCLHICLHLKFVSEFSKELLNLEC